MHRGPGLAACWVAEPLRHQGEGWMEMSQPKAHSRDLSSHPGPVWLNCIRFQRFRTSKTTFPRLST